MTSFELKPDPKKVIPLLHPDTTAVERVLSEFSFGDSVTIEDLAKRAKVNLCSHKSVSQFDSHERSARRRLMNGRGMVFHRKEGRITRLDDEGIKNLVGDRIRKSGKMTRGTLRISTLCNIDALAEQSKHELMSSVLQAKGAREFLDSKNGAKILRLVSNSKERIPELEQTWKALQGAL